MRKTFLPRPLTPGERISSLWSAILFAGLLVSGPFSLANTRFFDRSELQKLPPTVQRWYELETQFLFRGLKPNVFQPIDQNSQKAEFTPDQGRIFELKGYWIPVAELHSFGVDSLSGALKEQFIRTNSAGHRELLFLVHPESENFYGRLNLRTRAQESFFAGATASSRSLLVWHKDRPNNPFVAKLSLDAKIANTDRTISAKETAMSVGVNQLLKSMHDLPSSFAALPESMSAIPKNFERGGMILRELPHSDRTLVPFFSLFAPRSNGEPPLLLEIAKRAGQQPRAFVRQQIIERFVDQWLHLTIENGLSMEPHGQNILLELTKEGIPSGRIVHRDFGGFNVDLAFAEHKYGVNLKSLPLLSESLSEGYYQDNHRSGMRGSLVTYFRDGVLFNFENAWPEWIRKGWINEPVGNYFSSEIELTEIVETKLQKALGSAPKLNRKLQGIEDLVIFLRKDHLRSAPASCRRLFSVAI